MQRQTPSQTIGPFFSPALTPTPSNRFGPLITNNVSIGPDRVKLVGRILDGTDTPIVDAMVELFVDDGHTSRVGRSNTESGDFEFVLDAGTQSGEILIFMRGLLNHLYTSVFLHPNQTADNERLSLHGVVAIAEASDVYRADIRLQGDDATPFIDR